MHGHIVFHGVDFSGSRSPSGRIWISRWSPGTEAEVTEAPSRDQLLASVLACAEDGAQHLWLIDTAFGVPVSLLAAHGVEETWEAMAAWVSSFETPEAWREVLRRHSRREPKRLTDRVARTPFSPINVRMFRQTYHAVVSLLLPLRSSQAVALLPFSAARAPKHWRKKTVWLAEGCPASFLKQAAWRVSGYKGKEREKRKERKKLLALLAAQEGISLTHSARQCALQQPGGDPLDSVLLLPSAQRLLHTDHEEITRRVPVSCVEGWVYV